MTKYDSMVRDDSTNRCSNRLLTMIFVAISLQTILFIGVAVGLYMAYENHRGDLNALGDVPWGDMASDLREQYLSMDKNAINDILTNSKNLTSKANLLVHSHAVTIAADTMKITSKAADNTDLVDTVRKIIFDVQKPVDQLKLLINEENAVSINTLITTVKHFTEQLDEIELKQLTDNIVKLIQKVLDGLNAEALQSLNTLLNELNLALKGENINLVHTLAQDTDKTVQSINGLIDLLGTLNKK